jgi:transketolase
LMRVLPNMAVFQPADDWDTRQFMHWSLAHPGPAYLRLTRQNLPSLKARVEPFEMGRWSVVMPSPGAKIVILATGGLVEPAGRAAIELGAHFGQGSIEFVNANWIQPLDLNYIKNMVTQKPELIVTCEDHYVSGGLGGAVAESLAEIGTGARLLRIGVRGFGQSGSPEANYEHYGFTPNAIYDRVRVAMADLKGGA